MSEQTVFACFAATHLACAIVAVVRLRRSPGGWLAAAGFGVGFIAMGIVALTCDPGWGKTLARRLFGPRFSRDAIGVGGVMISQGLLFVALLVLPRDADRRRLRELLRHHPPVQCPACGAENPPNASQCWECKAKLPPVSPPRPERGDGRRSEADG